MYIPVSNATPASKSMDEKMGENMGDMWVRTMVSMGKIMGERRMCCKGKLVNMRAMCVRAECAVSGSVDRVDMVCHNIMCNYRVYDRTFVCL